MSADSLIVEKSLIFSLLHQQIKKIPVVSCNTLKVHRTLTTQRLQYQMEEEQDILKDSTLSSNLNVTAVEFKVVFNKRKFDVNFNLDSTIAQLKEHLHTIIGVPKEMQKVMVKGLAHDEKSLRDSGIVSGSKVMVIGSTFDDVLALSHQTATWMPEDKLKPSAIKEPLCQQKIHKKILDKGLPEDVMPGVKNAKEGLPPHPLNGMCNRGKVRLTFKMENDQIWIGTKERTEKISMSSIKTIVNEPIEGHEEYHIIGIQLGPTEASRYWIYWIPCQYVDAIKETILGKWHYF